VELIILTTTKIFFIWEDMLASKVMKTPFVIYLSIWHSWFFAFLSRIKDVDCKKHGELKDVVIFIDDIFLELFSLMQKLCAHLFSIPEPSH
jgi:hypothetical protein